MTEEATQADTGTTTTTAATETAGGNSVAALDTLIKTPEFRDKLLSGNSEARAQYEAAVVAASASAGSDEAMEAELLQLQMEADLPPDVVDMVRTGQAVPAREKVQAGFRRDALMKDESFVKRYLSGERAAKREMTLINIILAAPEA